MTILSSNLKYLRAEKGLSQQKVADSIGIKQKTYSNYENGNCEPSIDMLLILSRFFRTNVDILISVLLDITSITPKEKEELAHMRKIQEKTGFDNIDVIVESVKHIPEAVKAKKEKREAQPQTERMKEMRETSRAIKKCNE